MIEGLGAWRDKIREVLASGWMQAKWAASQPVYAVVSSAALWPVFDALSQGDPAKLFQSLMTVTSATATSLVANQLQEWKDGPGVTPGEVAEWVHRESMTNPGVLAEINLINEKLDTIAEARRTAGEERWTQLAQLLTAELRMLRSLPRFEASISSVTVESGAGGIAVGVLHNTGTFAPQITVHVVGDRYEGPRPANAEDSLRIYRSVLAGSHGRLSLRGLDTGAGDASSEQPQLGLAEVYVDLETTTRVRRVYRYGDPWHPHDPESGRPLRTLEAAAQHERLVVLGDPGSGKSTLLSHLALCLANHGLGPGDDWLARVRDWPDQLARLVPIVVLLRDFAGAMGQTTDDVGARHLWEFIGRRLADQKLEFAEAALYEALEGGNAIVLLDGMDEIPSGVARDRVRDAITSFQQRYRRSRHVVTCRTLAYQDPVWKLDGWPVVTLAPFDGGQIDRFIDAWHGELVRLNAIRMAEAADLATKLKRALRRPDLWRLAPNPLLLTVMALVQSNGGELPEARAELYERAVDMLLWRWDQLRARRGEIPRIRGLLAEAGRQPLDLQLKLAALAFSAHGSGGASDTDRVSDIGEGDLLRELASLHPGASRDWAFRIVEAIKLRAGLLLARTPGIYAFPHRTFQEYLAGTHLSNLASFPEEASRRLDDGVYWHNVVLLAVGRLVYVSRNVMSPLALVGELCPVEPKDDARSWRKAWMAGEALAEIGVRRVSDSELGRDLLVRVRARLKALVERGRLSPIERVAAGDALGKLGDPRFRADAWWLPDDDLLGFVEIPAGPFILGSDSRREPRRFGSDEFQQHQVELPTYFVGRYPVTVAQFNAFQSGDPSRLAGFPNHPVTRVSWHEALAYCDWLTEQLRTSDRTPLPLADLLSGRTTDGRLWRITLPSEAEWEKSARGPAPSRRVYPWGDEPDPEAANYDDAGIRRTSPVGSFPKGSNISYGVHDLSGNVWEWTRTIWGKDYLKSARVDRYEPSGVAEDLKAPDDVLRVLRGGTFDEDAGEARCSVRHRALSHGRSGGIGFRVALSPFGL